MNYIKILGDSVKIFRNSKLIWVLGLASVSYTLVLSAIQLVPNDALIGCLFLSVCLTVLAFSLLGEAGLIYSVFQVTLQKSLSWSEVWFIGKKRVFRIFGFLLIIALPILAIELIYRILAISANNSFLFWFPLFLSAAFVEALFTFGICAIMIDNIKAVPAAWTSFLISLNNILRVLLIFSSVFIIQRFLSGIVLAISVLIFTAKLPAPLTFSVTSFQTISNIPVVTISNLIFNLFLSPFTTVMLTLCYLQFTKEVSYPELAKQKTQPNTGST